MSRSPCGEIREVLSAHLDGDLDPGAAARVRDHLAGCPECAAELRALNLAVDALRRLPDLPAPTAILAGVRARLHPEPWYRRLLDRRPWLLGVPVGALATALVVVGVALFQARYPQLPTTAGKLPAEPSTVTREARTTAPESAVKTSSAPAPPQSATIPPPHRAAPPAAELRGRLDKIPARKAVVPPAGAPERAAPAPSERVATASAPASSPVPRSTPAREEAAREQMTRIDEPLPPPPRFVMPEPELDISSRQGLRPAGGGSLSDAGAPSPALQRRNLTPELPAVDARGATAFRTVDAPSPERVAAAPETGALRGTASPSQGAAMRADSARPPSQQSQLQAPMPAALESLTVLLPVGGDIEDIRGMVRRDGGRTLETRALAPHARREAFAPHRGQATLRTEVSRGWEMTVRIPRSAVAGFVEGIERRPGQKILELRPAAASASRGRPAQEQTLRITVLR